MIDPRIKQPDWLWREHRTNACRVEQTFLSAHIHQTETLESSVRTCNDAPPSPPLESRRRYLLDTFRLADAIPRDKRRAFQEARKLWLRRHPEPWTDAEWKEYNRRFDEKIEAWLNAGMGSRALARVDAREAVKNCLLRFDGERHRLHAAVIMPSHVHLLMEPLGGHDLSRILQGIKGASAREINKLMGVTGTFWLDESYDHVVRSEKQYWRFVRYIAENPASAGLRDHEYWLYRAAQAFLPAAFRETDNEHGRQECLPHLHKCFLSCTRGQAAAGPRVLAL